MNISVMPDFSKLAAPFLTVFGNALKVATEPGTDNIIQYSAPARIEPPLLLDGSLAADEFTPDILRTLLSLYGAYYMQAVGRAINIESMRLLRDIDALRPDRDLKSAVYDFAVDSLSQYHGVNGRDGLIDSAKRRGGELLSVKTEALALPDPSKDLPDSTYMVIESEGQAPIQFRRATKQEIDELEKRHKQEVQATVKEAVAQLKNASGKQESAVKMSNDLLDLPSLALGRIFEVTASYGDKKVTMPVLIRMNTSTSTPSNIVDIFTVGKVRRTMRERWHGWRSGELRFIEDILFSSDLIDAHKRAAIMDNTGTYLLNRERSQSNKLAALLTGKSSVGSASTIAVLNNRTTRMVEATLGGKLSNYSVREKLFKESYLMMLVDVDTDFKMVTVYHKGIPEATEMTVAEFTRAKSKQGSDTADIVKLFLNGSAPTL